LKLTQALKIAPGASCILWKGYAVANASGLRLPRQRSNNQQQNLQMNKTIFPTFIPTKKVHTLKKIIIAIDGHSSCGKSTLAQQLADELSYTYISSGKMYRAVTLYFLENKIDYHKPEAVTKALDVIHIHFEKHNGNDITFLNGKNVEKEIVDMNVVEHVSHVAAISAVRRAMVALQQKMGERKGIVMDGRDIGSVVFKDAELKLFVTANPDVRAQRRYQELMGKGQQVSLADIKKNLLDRDYIDSNRVDSPLLQASEAVLIDNSNLSKKEQLAMVLALTYERIKALQVNEWALNLPPSNEWGGE
jgi:CMP/dCMP kinase